MELLSLAYFAGLCASRVENPCYVQGYLPLTAQFIILRLLRNFWFIMKEIGASQ